MDLSLKRIIGYILDILLVTLVTTFIAQIKPLNPYRDKYLEAYQRYEELAKSDTEVDTEEIIQVNYDIYRYRIVSSGISVVCLILYFGLFEFLADGKTLGQKAMKLRIVHRDTMKRAGLFNYMFRIVILNNLIFTVLAMVLVLLLNPKSFYNIVYVISLLQNGLLLLNIVMIIMRNDHRGLHDMLSNTIVISDIDNIEVDELIEEKPKKESIKEKAEKRNSKKNKKDMI